VGIGPGIVVDKPVMAVGVQAADTKPNLNSEFGGGFTSVERGWNQRWQTLELRRYDRLSGYVWTELYDVEHEMAGLYDAERALKDSGGSIAADTNTETVIIPEIEPLAPGKDVVASSSGTVDFEVRISHHGSQPIAGDVSAAWGVPLGQLSDEQALELASEASFVGIASARPYVLGEPVQVSVTLPEDIPAARLHIALISGGRTVAITAVDVVR
jgi:hypothetical protein